MVKAKRTLAKYRGFEDVIPDEKERKRLRGRFSAAVSRCHNIANSGYRSYGGRGIFVSPEWRANKRLFLEHVVTLDNWGDPSMEMDRIDVDGPYAAGNIRFVSKSVNARNKRKVDGMQDRIKELEQRLRRYECGATQPLHDQDK